MINDKEEVIRYLNGVVAYAKHAIALMKTNADVSDVRACYSRIRNAISDTQAHLRSIKRKQVERRRK